MDDRLGTRHTAQLQRAVCGYSPAPQPDHHPTDNGVSMAFNFITHLDLAIGPTGPCVTGTITPQTATDWAVMIDEVVSPTVAGWTTESGYIHKQLSSAAPFSLTYTKSNTGVPFNEYANVLATFPTTGVVSVAQQIGNISGGVGVGTYTFPIGPPAAVTAGNTILV